jgi:hypothetical protein
MTAYISFRIILGVLLGIATYSLDRRFGVRSYRWWYDMTHEQPLAEPMQHGFVFNKPTRVKAFVALVLSSIVSVISVYTAASNPLAELVLWVVTIPAMMIGFVIGPHFYKLWQKRDKVFDTVDKWERGEIDLSDELKAKSAEITDSVRATVSGPKPKTAQPAAQPPVTAAETPQQEISREQAEEMVNRFTRDRKS